MERTRNRLFKQAAAACVTVLALYVLSAGPCVGWYSRSPSMVSGPGSLPLAGRAFYHPLFWAMNHCRPFDILMHQYFHVWYRLLPSPPYAGESAKHGSESKLWRTTPA